MNNTVQKLCFWSGFIMLLLFWFGFMHLADYLPPPSPELSGEELIVLLQNNLAGFRLGMILTMVAFVMLCTWGGVIAARLRVLEEGVPILTYLQLSVIGISSLIGMGSTWIFEAVAYRLDDTSPELIRMLHDLAWFTFLAPWPPFTIWCLAQALLIFSDKREVPDFPRWVGFICIWVGILFIPACLIFWYKSGPFAWNGLIAFYVPVAVFFIWVVPLSYFGLKAVARDADLAKMAEA